MICVQIYHRHTIQHYPTWDVIDRYAISLSNGCAKPISARYTTGEHASTIVIVSACIEDDGWEADVTEIAGIGNDSDMGGGEGGRTCER